MAGPGRSEYQPRLRPYRVALTCDNVGNCANMQVRGLRRARRVQGLPTAPAHADAPTKSGAAHDSRNALTCTYAQC